MPTLQKPWVLLFVLFWELFFLCFNKSINQSCFFALVFCRVNFVWLVCPLLAHDQTVWAIEILEESVESIESTTGCLLSFHTPWILDCGKMAHLTMDFTKYQMHYNVIPTYVENFIKIKQLWSPIQPPRLPEVRSKIYISSGHSLSNMCIYCLWMIPKKWLAELHLFLKNFSLVW